MTAIEGTALAMVPRTHTDKQVNKQTSKQRSKQTDRQPNRQTGMQERSTGAHRDTGAHAPGTGQQP